MATSIGMYCCIHPQTHAHKHTRPQTHTPTHTSLPLACWKKPSPTPSSMAAFMALSVGINTSFHVAGKDKQKQSRDKLEAPRQVVSKHPYPVSSWITGK